MGQNPIPAFAYGQTPSLAPFLIKVDASGHVIPSTGAGSGLIVPAPDATANLLMSDVVGNKADAAVEVVGATASEMAYVKGILSLLLAGGASNVAVSGAAVMSNGLHVFTVAGGPVQILSLVSICETADDTTPSTAQWATVATLGATAGTISGASASLASAAAGEILILQGNTLAAALLLESTGVGITAIPGSIVVQPGTVNLTIAAGSTTGTWKHFLRYAPLAPGAAVTAAF